MFGSRNKKVHSLAITDHSIRFLSLEKTTQEPLVIAHYEHDLDTGVVVKGEIVKAAALTKALKVGLGKKVKVDEIHLILPASLFEFHSVVVHQEHRDLKLKEKIKKTIARIAPHASWLSNTAYEITHRVSADNEYLFFECLNTEMFKSYQHICEQLGLKLLSVHADMQVLASSVKKKSTRLIYVDDSAISLVDVQNMMVQEFMMFPITYESLWKIVEKETSLGHEQSRQILARYGFLRAHKSPQVYRSLIQQVSPLLHELEKKNSDISVVFARDPYPGFVDLFRKHGNKKVDEIDFIKEKLHRPDRILPFHRDESYRYQCLVAQGVSALGK